MFRLILIGIVTAISVPCRVNSGNIQMENCTEMIKELKQTGAAEFDNEIRRILDCLNETVANVDGIHVTHGGEQALNIDSIQQMLTQIKDVTASLKRTVEGRTQRDSGFLSMSQVIEHMSTYSDKRRDVVQDWRVTTGDDALDLTLLIENAYDGVKCGFGTSCYFLSDGKLTWFKSAEFCTFYGWNLAEVSSKAEHDFLIKLIENKKSKDADAPDRFWLGGTKFFTSNWTWYPSFGEIGENHWLEDEPDNENEKEFCLEIGKEYESFRWIKDDKSGAYGWIKKNETFGWNDRDCWDAAHFICELNIPRFLV